MSLNFEEKKTKVYDQTGHTILESVSGKLKYKCGNCGTIKQSTYYDLMKPTRTKFCSSCTFRGKKTIEEVCEQFEQLKITGYTITDYKTNKQVTFNCDKNHTFIMSYNDIKRGRRCPQCAPKRRSQTNLEKYGSVNVFSNENIKEKIKGTCLEKYGVTHHMKLKEIREKAVETNLKNIDVKYAFNTEETFKKIRQTHFKKYGVEFPLQNSFIQAKISQTFLKKIGVTRPMIDQTYWKECLLDKYGVDHYSKTAQFKVDYTKTCLDKYGFDHPMKNKTIFNKAMSSSFRRKPFKFPSGRIDLVLGYEPRALEELLECYHEDDIITDVWSIPTFEYKRISSSLRPLKDKNYVMSTYYPDILLPDKIIEVKSAYLYYKDRVNVINKMKAVVKAGYTCELWVYQDEKHLEFKKSYKMIDNKLKIEKWVEIEE